MIKDDKRLGMAVILSILSFGIALGVGFYVYRFLWKNLESNEFAIWFLVFEVSQFLLLLDFGFSHKYIAQSKQIYSNEFAKTLNELRFVLFISAIFAVVVMGIVVLIFVKENTRLNIAFVFLSLSLFFNLLGYAETAALRVQRRNNEINIITIASQIIFVLLLLAFSYDAPLAIGVAVFSRSFVVYIAQVFRVNQKYLPRWEKRNHFGGSMVVINLAYFILFMVDVALLNVSLVSTALIAIILVVKKYLDLLRALWDSILPNFYTRFLDNNDYKMVYILIIMCAGSYLLSILLASWIIPFWLGVFSADPKLYWALGISFFGISAFRICTIRMYYKKVLNWKLIISIAIFSKLIFLTIIALDHTNVSFAYLTQGFILIGLILSIEIFTRKFS